MHKPLLHFNIFGISVNIEMSFLIFLVLIFAFVGNLVSALVFGIIIFISLFLHELGHALVLKHLNIPCSVHLIFMGGETRHLQGIPMSRSWEIILNGAGISANILLAMISFIFIKSNVLPNFNFFFEALFQINIFLSILNVIPVLPMDGGKLMNNLLACFLPEVQSIKITLMITIVLSVAICILSLQYTSFIFIPLIFGSFAFQAWQQLNYLKSSER